VVTRFYLPSSGAADITVTPSASWTGSTGYSALKAVRTKIASAMASHSYTNVNTAGTKYYLHHQYISEPLKQQTISGAIKGQIRCSESNAGLNATLAVCIRVVSPDGATVRGTLTDIVASDLINADPSEFATSLKNRKIENSSEQASIALTSVTARDGDRIVMEFGIRRTGTTTTWTSALSFGDDNATDLPENMTTTTANNPWLEFDSNLSFYIFADAFESNSFNAWTAQETGGTSTVTIVNSGAHHGTYCFQCYNSGGTYAATYKTFATSSTVNIRCYVKLNENIDANQGIYYIIYPRVAGSGKAAVHIFNNAGTMQWQLWDGTSTTEADATINTGQWYCVEIKTVKGVNDGEARLYVDDTELITRTGLSFNNDLDRCYVGAGLSDAAHTIFIDCVVVSGSQIGADFATYTSAFTFGSEPQSSVANYNTAFTLGTQPQKLGLTKTYSFGSQPQAVGYTKAFTFGTQPLKTFTTAAYTFATSPQKLGITQAYTFGSQPQATGLTKAFTFGSQPQKLGLTTAYTFGSQPQAVGLTKAFTFGTHPQAVGLLKQFTFNTEPQAITTTTITYTYATHPQAASLISQYTFGSEPQTSSPLTPTPTLLGSTQPQLKPEFLPPEILELIKQYLELKQNA
jgi:hypothetical protein